MSTNLLLAIIFTVGCLLLYLLKFAYIKAKIDYGTKDPKAIEDNIDVNSGLFNVQQC